MFSKYIFYYSFVFCIFLQSCTIAGSDFSAIFGTNVNKAQAWAKLLGIEGCPQPELWSGTVINVNESLLAGAKFIGNPNVTSRYECEFECCFKKEKGCNIAVHIAEQVNNKQ